MGAGKQIGLVSTVKILINWTVLLHIHEVNFSYGEAIRTNTWKHIIDARNSTMSWKLKENGLALLFHRYGIDIRISSIKNKNIRLIAV